MAEKSAFPTYSVDAWGQADISGGMTLRDWFAGHALAGMMAHTSALSIGPTEVARHCYQFADAMIAEREE